MKKRGWGFDTEGMDTRVRPQDDFYHYANGGWQDKNPIPKAESRWGSFLILRYETDKKLKAILDELENGAAPKAGTPERMVRDFTRSGLNIERRTQLGLKPLLPLISRIRALKHRGEVMDMTATLSRIGVSAPFGVGIDQDSKDTTRYILHIFQDGLGMPDCEYYLNDDPESLRVRNAYAAYVAGTLKLMGRTTKTIKDEQKRIMALETALARVSMDKVSRREIEKTYNKMNMTQLQKHASGIDWKRFMTKIGAPKATSFIVMQPLFIRGVDELLTLIPLEDWKLYLEWQLVSDYAGALTPAFERQTWQFYGATLTGAKAMKPRWRRVLNAVNSTLAEPLGRIYVRKHFTEHAKRKMNALVDDLFEAYEARIKNLDWMSAPTKKKALQKLHAMGRKIGYPDKWRSYTSLVIRPDDYIGNLMRSAAFEHKREMRKLPKKVDRSEWYCAPQIVNAFNAPNLNDITFPAAILQPPFFDPDGDAALNYGAIGAVIGHEITHSFDDEGAKFDKDGNLREWWTAEDKKRFQQRSKIIEEQYSKYEVADGIKVNGKLTLGENIADLGGMAIAYDAYQTYLAKHGREDIDGFSPEQRFFLGFALFERENVRPEFEKMATLTDPHSPGVFRINGPMANSTPFYLAFGVKKGDALYRDVKVRTTVW